MPQCVRVHKSGGRFVEAVLAVGAEPEAVGASERAMPGVPRAPVGMLGVKINCDFACVVQQGCVCGGGGPCLRLGSQ